MTNRAPDTKAAAIIAGQLRAFQQHAAYYDGPAIDFPRPSAAMR